MLRPTSTLLVLWVWLLVQPGPAGMQPPAPQEQQPVFRTGVSLVRVDVTVTGRDGEPVTDLSADDFEIEENGVPQKIESCELIRRDGTAPADSDMSLEIRSIEHGEAEAAREDIRLFAIFLDDYHVQRRLSTLLVREALVDFVKNDLGETDLLTVMDPLTPLSALRFTRSRYELIQQLQAFEGRRGIYMPARSVLEEEQLRSRNVERIRSQVTLSALEALVTHLGNLREGRSSVILVSEGFSTYDTELQRQLRDVYEAANRFSVTVNVLEPRGLTSERLSSDRDTLWTLAQSTGGRTVINTNDLHSGLREVVRDASAYYLLAYSPQETPADGAFHKIGVRVKRPGVRVVARRGYWSAPTKSETAAAEAPPLAPEFVGVQATLPNPKGPRAVYTWVGTERGSANQTLVTFCWQPVLPRHGSAEGDRLVPSVVSLVVKDTSGHTVATLRMPRAPLSSSSGHNDDAPTQASFESPAGDLTFEAVVSSQADEVIDSWREAISIPDYARAALAMATPRFFVASSGPQARQLAREPDATPVATREFRQGDHVTVDVPVYARADDVPRVSVQLLNQAGQVLVELPVSAAANGSHQFDLPLRSLTWADYLLRIAAQQGDQQATAVAVFRLSR